MPSTDQSQPEAGFEANGHFGRALQIHLVGQHWPVEL